MRSRYTKQSGTEAFFDEVIPHSLVRLLVTFTDGFSDVAAGMGTTSQSGSNPSILNPVGTATSTAYELIRNEYR